MRTEGAEPSPTCPPRPFHPFGIEQNQGYILGWLIQKFSAMIIHLFDSLNSYCKVLWLDGLVLKQHLGFPLTPPFSPTSPVPILLPILPNAPPGMVHTLILFLSFFF